MLSPECNLQVDCFRIEAVLKNSILNDNRLVSLSWFLFMKPALIYWNYKEVLAESLAGVLATGMCYYKRHSAVSHGYGLMISLLICNPLPANSSFSSLVFPDLRSWPSLKNSFYTDKPLQTEHGQRQCLISCMEEKSIAFLFIINSDSLWRNLRWGGFYHLGINLGVSEGCGRGAHNSSINIMEFSGLASVTKGNFFFFSL